ncbi:MAG: hypothetical protein AB7P21_07135 [Lautropia sp.]
MTAESQQPDILDTWRREAEAHVETWPTTEAQFRRQAMQSIEAWSTILQTHLSGIGAPGFRIAEQNLQQVHRAFDILRRIIETSTVIDDPEARRREALTHIRCVTRLDSSFARAMEDIENPADDVGDVKE